MKILALAALFIMTATAASANPCSKIHKRCAAKGKGGGRVYACEKKAAKASHNVACLASLKKHKPKHTGA